MFKLSYNQITRTVSRSITTSSILRNATAATAATATTTIPKSSCPAGTVLNLKVRKNGDEPVALEDSEYPEWLWGMLDKAQVDETLKKTDIMKWRRKQLRKANTNTIKNNNFLTQM
ncbi:hypothetical protein DFJ63DRAFT_114292 [Scheffersomyces coipomensis]|uniref:uncharacterized protein n=1 Tax=Scheffersomyces coipomensis TaxID=1788519 RepID=UPI00315C616E